MFRLLASGEMDIVGSYVSQLEHHTLREQQRTMSVFCLCWESILSR